MLVLIISTPAFADMNTVEIGDSLAQQVATSMSGIYGAPANLDNVVYDPSSASTWASGSGGYGVSQQAVIKALFAMGQSMDMAGWQSIKNTLSLGYTSGSSLTNSPGASTNNVSFLSGAIIVPVVCRAFATMDLYIQSFFTGRIIFVLMLALTITLGVAVLVQMHEGKLDVVALILKATLAVFFMLKSNMICNWILAIGIGLAACINCSVVSGITSQSGINNWYLSIYGSKILQSCYSVAIARPGISAAYSSSYDMENIRHYVMNENGASLATSLCEALGGYAANNGTATFSGIQINDAVGYYSMITVYNIGLLNLAAHGTETGVDQSTNILNFQVGMAQVFFSDNTIVAGDSKVAKTISALSIGTGNSYAYLAGTPVNSDYNQPVAMTTGDLTSADTALHGGSSALSAIGSAISSLWAAAVHAGYSAYAFVTGIPAAIMTALTQGVMQLVLMLGMVFWIVASLGLCKMGVILTALTSPFLVLEKTKGVFWKAFKAMYWPAIYPCMLIILMQMDAALAGILGTMVAGASQLTTPGLGMVVSMNMAIWVAIFPLLMGMVVVIMLPKITKSFLEGGNAFVAQMSGAIELGKAAVIAAVGAVLLPGVGAAAGAGAAGAGAAGGAAAGGAGAAAGAGAGAAAPAANSLSGAAQTVAQKGMNMASNAANTVISAPGKMMDAVGGGMNKSAGGRALFRTIKYGIPGLVSKDKDEDKK